MIGFKRKRLFFLALLGQAFTAQAAVQISGTRVIYPAGQREVTVNVHNGGDTPRLLQVWVDNGNSEQTAENAQSPFLVTPPIARVNAGKGQALRVIHAGGDLPVDRESVFWLNVLDIPPQPKKIAGSEQNILQFAVRSRIKIFYRPQGLEGKPVDAYHKVTWRLAGDGDGQRIECINDSAYNLSFGSLLVAGSATDSPLINGGMCPAKGRQSFVVDKLPSDGIGLVVNVINDYGGIDPRAITLTR